MYFVQQWPLRAGSSSFISNRIERKTIFFTQTYQRVPLFYPVCVTATCSALRCFVDELKVRHWGDHGAPCANGAALTFLQQQSRDWRTHSGWTDRDAGCGVGECGEVRETINVLQH